MNVKQIVIYVLHLKIYIKLYQKRMHLVNMNNVTFFATILGSRRLSFSTLS